MRKKLVNVNYLLTFFPVCCLLTKRDFFYCLLTKIDFFNCLLTRGIPHWHPRTVYILKIILLFKFFLKGYLASYFGPELQKYTSFKVHHEEIRHVTINDLGVLSLSCDELCFSARAGLRLFSLRLVLTMYKLDINCNLTLEAPYFMTLSYHVHN